MNKSSIFSIFIVLATIWSTSTFCMLSGVLSEWKYAPHIQVHDNETVYIRQQLKLEAHLGILHLGTSTDAQISMIRLPTVDEEENKCSYYALKQATGNNINLRFSSGEQSKDCIVLNKYFKQTINPKKNDLVIYTNNKDDLTIKHFAVVIDDFTFESKWGECEPIFQHGLFDIPDLYGFAAGFFTLKKEYATEKGKQHLCNDIKYEAIKYAPLSTIIQLSIDKYDRPLTYAIAIDSAAITKVILRACLNYITK